jgi:predicted porin
VMRKLLLALAVFGAFASVSHAQSSVALYGVIDDGLTFNDNSASKNLYGMASGMLLPSRFGLRGVEDLGGDLKAVFVLENGFDVNTGVLRQGSLLFGRQAYAGLSNQFGTVTLGRQYDPLADFVAPLEAGDQWAGYIGAHPGDIDNLNLTFRENNAVKFTSASYDGLKWGAFYSFGGQAQDFSANQIWSVGAGYSNGPLALGVGYLNVRTPAAFGSLFNNGASALAPDAAVSSSIDGGFASANIYQVAAAGGAYKFGDATFGAVYSNVRFENLGATFSSPYSGESAMLNNAEFNFKYYLNPRLLVGAEYNYTLGSSIQGTPRAQYHQGTVGVDYFLSRTTDIYAIAAYQHASGETLAANGSLVAATADLNELVASSNQNQFATHVGIRHRF